MSAQFPCVERVEVRIAQCKMYFEDLLDELSPCSLFIVTILYCILLFFIIALYLLLPLFAGYHTAPY